LREPGSSNRDSAADNDIEITPGEGVEDEILDVMGHNYRKGGTWSMVHPPLASDVPLDPHARRRNTKSVVVPRMCSSSAKQGG
jgi:hypothetical protein